jgi:hypothetical protein
VLLVTLGVQRDGACDSVMPGIDTATLVYTPREGFPGEDRFTYVVSSGGAVSAPATVAITVGVPPSSSCGAEIASGEGPSSPATAFADRSTTLLSSAGVPR